MRRDAQARRDALIRAAEESFAERGYSVPLEEVAARAGVGRGTLYRNFKDRAALALAILAREMDRIEEIVARAPPFRAAMVELALAGARGSALFGRIGTELVADAENIAAFEALGERLATVLEPLARRAREDGTLRDDIDGARLGLAVRMVSSLFHTLPVRAAAAGQLDAALDVILDGIRRPRGGIV